ncbi:MAG: hypothetical protein WC833_07865 [Bacteroidales bacterium]|jgi:hypothetical protein
MKTIKRLKELAAIAVVILSTTMFTACGLIGVGISSGQPGYGYGDENPQWAPPYYSGARYYYLPDIECYYDLSNRNFIYLTDGRWFYTQNIPSMYSNFDLYNSFAIVLDINVYQPWMHHQYYVSHYPRYYYRDYYDHSNFPYVRGFNENRRSAIYWGENDRHRARKWDDQNVRTNRNFNYSKEDRQQQQNWNNQNQGVRRENQEFNRQNQDANRQIQDINRQNQDVNRQNQNTNRQNQEYNRQNQENNRQNQDVKRQNTENNRPPVTTQQGDRNEKTNYYGKPIGNSVKVRKEMQNREQQQKAEVKKNTEQKRNAEVKKNTEQKQKAETKKSEEKKKEKKESGSVYRR